MPKILVVQIAALGYRMLRERDGQGRFGPFTFQPLQTVFPALTCPVQASFRTGQPPSFHGIPGNGFFSRELSKVFFWEQSSSLISGPRIWEQFRKNGKTVGQLFWQQSLGHDADIILSPAPIHRHHGRMIEDCFSRPPELYRDLIHYLGRPFPLKHYWGPAAALPSTAWIVRATGYVMRSPAPDLLLTYLPHLDYDLQRYGPSSPQARQALDQLKPLWEELAGEANKAGYWILAFSDYAMTEVSRPLFPNLALRKAGWLHLRSIKRMTYPDLYTSRAFALADHQIAHVILKDHLDTAEAATLFKGVPGIAKVLLPEEQEARGIKHPRTGDLVLVAERDSWFAYPWWEDPAEAPDFASHVDIHRKPGYDPAELYRGRWPWSTSVDAAKIHGSHGRTDPDLEAAWATNLPWSLEPASLLDLSRILQEELNLPTTGKWG